jgi:hypothetical protein
MEKITVKELTEFRKKSERSKKTLALKLKTRSPKIKTEEDKSGGGNYWKPSTSCVYNVFKQNDPSLYDSKIEELIAWHNASGIKHVKERWLRNIEILNNMKDFDFDAIKPSNILSYQSIPRRFQIITIDKFPVYVSPEVVFSYEKNGKSELGALWLVTLLNGYKKEELGMFCEMLYMFLDVNYSEKFQLSPDHCIVIDTYSGRKVTYSELIRGDVPFLVKGTLEEIKKL